MRGEPPAVAWLGAQLEGLGYSSWAYRVVNTASAPPRLPTSLRYPVCNSCGLIFLRMSRLILAVPEDASIMSVMTRLSRFSSSHVKAVSCHPHHPRAPAGFGMPHRRKRVFLVASYYGDARDVLLSQVLRQPCSCISSVICAE